MSRTYRKSQKDSWKSKSHNTNKNYYDDNYSSTYNKNQKYRRSKLSIYDY